MAGRFLLMMLLASAILGVMGKTKADIRHYPYHYPRYYPPYYYGDYNYHHHYYRHFYPASPYYYRYRYTQICEYLVARPLLLARLHGLLSYYMKYCYGSIYPFPSLG